MLIAESGSTKTEWRLCKDGKVEKSFRSRGFNPNVMPAESILADIRNLREQHLSDINPEQIFFYGAGTRGDAQNRVVSEVFKQVFPHATVFVGYDLLAAARSTGRMEGLAGILGTGSSVCLHRHFDIVSIKGGHGYIFGDEGSGADLGRTLVKGLLQEDFPSEVLEYVEKEEGMSLSDLKMAVTRHPKPNVRLASMAPYLREFLEIPEVRVAIRERFALFLKGSVCHFNNFQTLPLDIIGSIGFYYQDIFKEAADRCEVHVGKFIQNPIENLVNFHLRPLDD